MRLRLDMVDRSEYGIAGAAILSAWYAGAKLALWLVLHPWAQKVSQVLFTLALAVATVTVQHYWHRYLHRRAPIEEPPQGEIPARARFDLFELFRRGMARLRKAKRRRTES